MTPPVLQALPPYSGLHRTIKWGPCDVLSIGLRYGILYCRLGLQYMILYTVHCTVRLGSGTGNCTVNKTLIQAPVLSGGALAMATVQSNTALILGTVK